MMMLEEFIQGYNKLVQETGYRFVVPVQEIVIGSMKLTIEVKLEVHEVEPRPQSNGVPKPNEIGK